MNTTYSCPNRNAQFRSKTFNRGVQVIRDRYGKVRCIGNVFINYDRYVKLNRVSSIYMKYKRSDILTQVGGLRVKFNHLGEIIHTYG